MTDRRSMLASLFAWIPFWRKDECRLPEPEWGKALAFYRGEQWPAEVMAQRIAVGRPCIVLNQMPSIVADRAERAGVAEDTAAWRRIVLDAYREFADEHRIYNFTMSNYVERAALEMEHMRVYPPSGLAIKIAQQQAAERASRLRECPPWRSS